MNDSVFPLSQLSETDTRHVGGKAANLARLLQADLPVPNGLVVSLSAFKSDGTLKEDAKEVVGQFLTPEKLYAVRSSALAEDAEGASWAGLFETFLDTDSDNVLNKVEECHNSAKNRAKAYAEDKAARIDFDIAVVVQEMIRPEYAGVLFTKDPVSGEDVLVTEYVAGLGEELVSGRADPKRLVISEDQELDAPFDTKQLADLAIKVERLFGVPQDIEWAWADNKMWLVQARPITTTQETRSGYYLGEPEELFYWGPSRTKPMYMSEFMAAVEKVFKQMVDDPNLPTPPSNMVLFDGDKMVWLSNANDFFKWCEKTFEAYEKLDQLDSDISNWQAESKKMSQLSGAAFNETAINAWYFTELAEFSLYGAEAALTKRLSRFDAETRQAVWSAFTIPDKPSFLNRIDKQLAESRNPVVMAEKYPWIQDGYHGLSDKAQHYFEERLKIIGDESQQTTKHVPQRQELSAQFNLTDSEVSALTLARRLAEFMDDRKAWMMQTRRLLKQSVGNIEHGWFFNGGKVSLLNQEDTHELWQRYVDFKASSNAVIGIVASNGGKQFVNGEVVVVHNPTDVVEDGKIVVVPSTSPSYVPLMRKAKALVTDHGGMMSHAAIVAREFNLPCIVGTKQATKVLQTGNKVVLDLVTGDVKV